MWHCLTTPDCLPAWYVWVESEVNGLARHEWPVARHVDRQKKIILLVLDEVNFGLQVAPPTTKLIPYHQTRLL